MRRALALLLVPLALAGCASEPGTFGFQRADATPEPYYREHREVLSGEHAKRFEVPVEQPAQRVNVTVTLDARTNGLSLPEMAPAWLEVRLLDPSGTPLREARLDAREPHANLVLDAPLPGLYHVEVEGAGASQDVDGATYGAGYLLAIEIVYE